MYRVHLLATLVLAPLAAANDAAFDADRDAILSMAGEYAVSFRFDEHTTFAADSESSGLYETSGMETVKVIEDRGDFISLQHLLVVGSEDRPHVVKHWRQDWTYEPAAIHTFRGDNIWERVSLSDAEREGAWSQAVYQVDDSPRYAAVARWEHIGGHSFWESPQTWRPLPRREMEKREDYDVLVSRNRHSIVDGGWLHEQDNYKLALRDGEQQILARESGYNAYEAATEFDFEAANTYWEATGPFWAQVRAEWTQRFANNDRIELIPVRNGDALHERLFGLARRYGAGNYDSIEVARGDIASEIDRYTVLQEARAR